MKTIWTVDAGHSTAQFKVRHLAVSNVSGTFKSFRGEVSTERDDFDQAQIHFVIDAASLDTNLEQRDGHLRSADFLNVEGFPEIVFDGKLNAKVGGEFLLNGTLSLRGVTRPVTLEALFAGSGKDRIGRDRTGFEIEGKIRRKDYGLLFDMITETGGLVIGEDIKLAFDIELLRPA